MVHIQNRILAIKKKEQSNAICSNLDEPRDCHTDSHTVRHRKANIYIYITYMWNLKKSTNQLIYKAEVESQM